LLKLPILLTIDLELAYFYLYFCRQATKELKRVVGCKHFNKRYSCLFIYYWYFCELL